MFLSIILFMTYLNKFSGLAKDLIQDAKVFVNPILLFGSITSVVSGVPLAVLITYPISREVYCFASAAGVIYLHFWNEKRIDEDWSQKMYSQEADLSSSMQQ